MTKSVYIHIPFCKSKCKYCSFVSFTTLKKKRAYLDALKEEILHNYEGERLETIYFGGGTPSLMTPEEFREILSLLNPYAGTEITVELNPETLTQGYLNGLKKSGINRISIGCQTFDNNILKLTGRRHNSQQVEKAVTYAQNAGFDNISLDFIYGLPTQTVQDFEKDLLHALSLGISHISLYGLKIEEGCYFYKNMPENLPNNDTQADMYLKAVETLKNFEHYEISNFGKPSRHNLTYWNNSNYYGFGCAAHGYINNVRYANTDNLTDYIKNSPGKRRQAILTKQQQLEEEIFLGFRKIKGINISDINNKFNIDFETKYSKILSDYKEFFVKTDDRLALTLDGILVSNSVLSEFLQ